MLNFIKNFLSWIGGLEFIQSLSYIEIFFVALAFLSSLIGSFSSNIAWKSTGKKYDRGEIRTKWQGSQSYSSIKQKCILISVSILLISLFILHLYSDYTFRLASGISIITIASITVIINVIRFLFGSKKPSKRNISRRK